MGTPSTKFGDNANFSGSSALAFGDHSTAVHNSYHILFGNEALTESQVKDFIRGAFHLPEIEENIEKYLLDQDIKNVPRIRAAHDDYQSQKQGGMCFKGTREAILEALATWIIDREKSQIYALSGLAGIGKSTIAYTLAARATKLGILGASFFFSRDEVDRTNAEKFFTTLAFQLCVHDKEFAQAIGQALRTERGTNAVTKDLNEQLDALIIEPLRDIIKSRSQPTVIVVDALDECNDRDSPAVLASLERLVQNLPSFKVLLTTRPQPHLDHRLRSHDVFHLQNIEDKIINSDIRFYLKYNLSRENVEECLPDLTEEWRATDGEIEHLVETAGKLFIIASTAVRFILDTVAYDPASQLETLKADSQLRFNDLKSFYRIIVRRAVPEQSPAGIMKRFKTVIGAILFVQEPLPITALQQFTFPYTVRDIDAVLKNLKSVITFEHNTPRIYHKSFSDFLIETCRETGIISEGQHTLLANTCFTILNGRLKRNILGIKGSARFLNNADGLERQGVWDDEFREKIPLELDYACSYWATHLEGASISNLGPDHQVLMEELARFANEHLPHWIEVMSWIRKLILVSPALRIVQALLSSKSTAEDPQELFSDGLRFISKFYAIIEESALHTYHSALTLTPTSSLLYKRYHKETTDNLCQVQGGPEKWNRATTLLSHGNTVDSVMFSRGGTMLASWNDSYVKFWDAITGALIGTIVAEVSEIAKDFSIAASFDGGTIAIYDIKSCACVTTLSVAPETVVDLAISPDSGCIAALLSDDNVGLWDCKKDEPVVWLQKFAWDEKPSWLMFNPSGDRLVVGDRCSLKLLNGINGELIADLRHRRPEFSPQTVFSRDGSLIAYTDGGSLWCWDTKTGTRIGATYLMRSRSTTTICTNGSLIAIGKRGDVTLWCGNSSNGSIEEVATIYPESPSGKARSISYLMFLSDDMLAIECRSENFQRFTTVYDVKERCFVTMLPPFFASSPDNTRFVDAASDGTLELWEMPSILFKGPGTQKGTNSFASRLLKGVKAYFSSSDSSSPDGGAREINDLDLSPCSQLAVCHDRGAVELWDTSCDRQLITTLKASSKVNSCVFSADGTLLAFALSSGIIKLWDVRGGAYVGALELKYPKVTSMVFLRGMLAVGSKPLNNGKKVDITLWDLKTHHPIVTVMDHNVSSRHDLLSFFHHDTMLAYSEVPYGHIVPPVYMTVWDTDSRKPYATVNIREEPLIYSVERALLSPDKSKLVIQLVNGDLKIFDLVDGGGSEVMVGTRREVLDWNWLPPIRRWHGIPVWLHQPDQSNNYRVSGYDGAPMSLLRFPPDLVVRTVAHGPSIFVIIYDTGSYEFDRILILRENPTGSFN